VALLRRSRFGPYFVITSSTVGPLVVADDPAGPQVAVGTNTIDIERFDEWLEAAGQ
jgi:hypothetical protein